MYRIPSRDRNQIVKMNVISVIFLVAALLYSTVGQHCHDSNNDCSSYLIRRTKRELEAYKNDREFAGETTPQNGKSKEWAIQTLGRTGYDFLADFGAYAVGTVQSVFWGTLDYLKKTAEAAMDQATKIAYMVWTVLFDEVSGVFGPYRNVSKQLY